MATNRPAAHLLAYVLHRHDWSETSLIVELFTRERGRLVVVAKGAKRPTSNFRPVLLPFQPLHALLGKAPADEQAEVLTLRGAEWAGGQPLLQPAALLSGFYLNELLLKLLARQDPHPGLFDAYADTLAAMAGNAGNAGETGDAGSAGSAGSAGGADEATALRAFELMMLRELGVLPDLACATQSAEPVRAATRYSLQAEAGVVAAAAGLSGAHWVALEAALRHGSASAVRHACAPVAGGLRVPLRELLNYHLGTGTLRTRQVWQGVQKLIPETPRAPKSGHSHRS